MQRINRVFAIIDKAFFWLAFLILGGMTAAIFLQVIFRYIVHQPLASSEELARFLFIWMTFIGGYLAARRGQHIGVELLQNMFPKMVKQAMQVLSNLIATGFFAIVSYYCIALWGKLSTQISPALELPMSFVYLGMIIGCVFMGLCYFLQAVMVCVPVKAGEEK